MKKRFTLLALILLAYVAGYIVFRKTHLERWERDGRDYVIFPAGYPALYYVFRPLSYLDGALTHTQCHIGPHR
jgi:hypothetical protein